MNILNGNNYEIVSFETNSYFYAWDRENGRSWFYRLIEKYLNGHHDDDFATILQILISNGYFIDNCDNHDDDDDAYELIFSNYEIFQAFFLVSNRRIISFDLFCDCIKSNYPNMEKFYKNLTEPPDQDQINYLLFISLENNASNDFLNLLIEEGANVENIGLERLTNHNGIFYLITNEIIPHNIVLASLLNKEQIESLIDSGRMEAIIQGDIENINTQNSKGFRPLNYAASKSERFVKLLLDFGAEPNFLPSPLQDAIKEKNIKTVELLLDAGSSVEDEKIIEEAIEQNNYQICELLINAGAKINSQKNLELAIREGNTKIAEMLLKAGLKVNDNSNFLEIAADDLNTEMVRLLVSAGLKARNEVYLDYSIRNKFPEIAILLLESGLKVQNETILVKILEKNNIKIIKPLINSACGKTPLLCLAMREKVKIETVKFLLDSGADPNAKDGYGKTCLFFTKNYEKIKLLLEAGCDPNIKDTYGQNCLFDQEDYETIELLLKSGCDPNVFSKSGKSAISRFLYNTKILQLLIKYGVDLNKRGEQGETIFSYFYGFLAYEIWEILFNAGLNPNMLDNNLPIFHTILDNNPTQEKINLILRFGANINLPTLSGNTVLHSLMEKYCDNLHSKIIEKENYFKDVSEINSAMEDTFKLLISAGVNPKIKNTNGLNYYEYLQELLREKIKKRDLYMPFLKFVSDLSRR